MKKILILIATGLFISVLYGCDKKPAYPDISQVTYTLINGNRLSMKELSGRPVIVTFWATSCAACIREIPDLIELHNRYAKDGLKIIAVAMPYDRPDHVLEFTKARKLPYSVALDIDTRVVRAFGNITITPNNFLIDPNGRIAVQQTGILNKLDTIKWLDAIRSSRN